MAKLCEQVDQITNHCLVWVDYQPVFPKLTLLEGNQIGFACLLVFATAFVLKMCIKALNTR